MLMSAWLCLAPTKVEHMYMLVAHLAHGAQTCRHMRRQLNLESQFESSATNPDPETPLRSTTSFGETTAVGAHL